MAQKRMFSLQIVDSDAFLDMPVSSQLLYFHLAMRADDDGFVDSPKKIVKIANASHDDVKMLITKRFILTFESGVIVIKHWKIHNYIQNDRYKETKYLDEKNKIITKENGSYTECIQNVSSMDTQVRLGKIRLEENRIDTASEQSSQINEIMSIFQKINPTINYGNKTQRNAIIEIIKKIGFEKTTKSAEYAVSVFGERYAPQITTPYQLKEKLSQLIGYHSRQGNSEIINLDEIS